MSDVRCPSKKHAVLLDAGILEVKCDSRFCGAKPGIIVLHRFSLETGELLETSRYSDPGREVKHYAAQHNSAPVRSA